MTLEDERINSLPRVNTSITASSGEITAVTAVCIEENSEYKNDPDDSSITSREVSTEQESYS